MKVGRIVSPVFLREGTARPVTVSCDIHTCLGYLRSVFSKIPTPRSPQVIELVNMDGVASPQRLDSATVANRYRITHPMKHFTRVEAGFLKALVCEFW